DVTSGVLGAGVVALDLILYTDSGSTGIRVRDLFWRGPGGPTGCPDAPPTGPRPGLEGRHPPTEARV
ncbi:hypothetical protein, partial [Streptomyces lunaelactis]|uniref:hypothetical protein n=1 Tax=Streptomyces lunaelactis TaxID=1535768 RepID=UPI001C30B1C8